MAQLDRFLTALSEYKAEALILHQDSPPQFRFLSGTKPVSQQVLDLNKIASLLTEIAATDPIEALETEGSATFTYELGDVAYTAVLEQDAGKLVATLWETTTDVANTAEESAATGVSNLAAAVEEEQANAENAEKIRPAAMVEPVPEQGPSASQVQLPDFGVNSTAEAIPADLPPQFRDTVDKMLREMIAAGASDLHLSSQCAPVIRVDGSIRTHEGYQVYDPESMIRLLFSITPRRNREQFLETRDTDFAYAIKGVSRFRVNLFYDRKGPGAVIRAIPNEILTPEQLGLPPVVRDLAVLTKGLVLVTGPTGSGKSTTLATILDLVNSTREEHVITVEDPIEFVHPNKKCLVNQREVGVHTGGFRNALRAALREDPDVVLVGEMRDLETVEIAIETAETGHLVFATLHTTTAASTVDRLVDQFPADRQDQIRTMLSDSLKAVISQTLCKKVGGGRVAALEILLGTPSVANLIREAKTHQIGNAMQTGRKLGMQTLNDHLVELVQNKVIDPREAYVKAVDKPNLLEALKRKGFDIKI